MRSGAPIRVIVQFPATGEGRGELARRVAEAHADFVIGTISRLSCPVRQKLDLLQAVMAAAERAESEPTEQEGPRRV